MSKIKVAILGATGTVGQRFIQLLENHPWFEVSELLASTRSAGRTYLEAVSWKLDSEIPNSVKNLVVKSEKEIENFSSQIAFSGLDASVAREIEFTCAKNGMAVVSNTRNFRMEKEVPLLIPEINPDHLFIIPKQKDKFGFDKGFILTNSNCSTMFLAMVLGAISKRLTIEKTFITTMQAISGAGYPGVASLDILGNVIPFISGEEEKIETETLKILGKLNDSKIESANFDLSASVNRVPVIDGHLESVSIKLKEKTSVKELTKLLANFSALPQKLNLPTAPKNPIIVLENDDRPQPRLDVNKNNGMATFIGRIRKCKVLDFKMTILGHNTIRGAAGAAILNAELLVKQGLLQTKGN